MLTRKSSKRGWVIGDDMGANPFPLSLTPPLLFVLHFPLFSHFYAFFLSRNGRFEIIIEMLAAAAEIRDKLPPAVISHYRRAARHRRRLTWNSHRDWNVQALHKRKWEWSSSNGKELKCQALKFYRLIIFAHVSYFVCWSHVKIASLFVSYRRL